MLPFTCDWRTGGCVAPTFPEAGLQPVPGADADDLLVVGGAGLTCSTRGLARVSVFGLVATVAAAAALLARRRQRRGNRR